MKKESVLSRRVRQNLKIEITGGEWPEINNRVLKRIARRVLRGEKAGRPGRITVVLMDDESIRALNHHYLGKDRATDVLAFTYGEEDIYGETYISVERAKEQAAEYGVSIEHETARLVIHGLLHLLGYEDNSPECKNQMTILEDHYLKSKYQKITIKMPAVLKKESAQLNQK